MVLEEAKAGVTIPAEAMGQEVGANVTGIAVVQEGTMTEKKGKAAFGEVMLQRARDDAARESSGLKFR